VTIASSSEQPTDPRTRDAFFIVEPNRTQLARVASLIDEGVVRPIVGAVFPIAEVRRAYEHKPAHG
jgi:NADPH:quinone reductase-like Zn-dependent oxidoreductase